MAEDKAKKTTKTTAAKRSSAAKPAAASKAKTAPQQNAGVLTIDGVEYPMDKLSERALAQVANLRATDERMERLQQEMAMIKTARKAYSDVLKAELDAANTTLQ